MGKATIHQLDTSQKTSSASSQLALKADRKLAKQAASGDREAFREIVNVNKQRMFTVARSVVGATSAEDVVQEAFIKAYRALPNFRGDSRLSTWLFRITYLTAIDTKRQQQRWLQIVSDDDNELDVVDTSTGERSEAKLRNSQLQQSIDKALSHLSPFEQTVFTLRHMQNFKLREIAEVVNRSEGTIKNILFRAIRKMRQQLEATQNSLQEIERC